MNQDTQAKVQEWRRKALAGTLSIAEMREAVRILREDRISAHASSAKAKARKAPVNSDDLLDQLEGL